MPQPRRCTKLRYSTEAEAIRHIKRHEITRQVFMHHYWCPACKGYHLGHSYTDTLRLIDSVSKSHGILV